MGIHNFSKKLNMLRFVNPAGTATVLTVDQTLNQIRESDDDFWLSGSGEAEIQASVNAEVSIGIKRIPSNAFRVAYSASKSAGMRYLLQNPLNTQLLAVFVGGDFSLEPASLYGSFEKVETAVRRLAAGISLEDINPWVQWEELEFERQGESLTLEEAEHYLTSLPRDNSLDSV